MTDVDSSHDEQQRWIGREVGGKYRILRIVGHGGMGAVYEAENLALGKRVAIKLIDLESAGQSEAVQRFEREARTAGALESSHIVQVFDVGKLEDGRPYLVMELLRGENLGARLHRLGPLSVQEALHVTVQVLRGLHRAHDNGVVHRDLKPENIFLVETDGDPMFAKIVDFGISKITRRGGALDANTLTQQGVVLGTPFYMAPEQAQALADLDGRADLWSLGAILYECLTGRRPFTGDNYEQVIIAICTQPAPSLHGTPGIPAALANVVGKALARQREDRFPSAREFLEALQAAVPDLVGALPPSIDATTDGRVLAAGVANGGTHTDRSWSSGKIAVPSKTDGPVRGSRGARIVALGAMAALLAVALVVGLVSRRPPTDPYAGLVGSHVQPSSSAPPVAVRVETNAEGTVVSVDGREVSDATVRGRAGDRVRVRVRAPGFLPEDSTWTLDAERTVVRVDLRPEGARPEPSGSESPAAVRAPRAVPTTRTPGAGSGSLTGGLELKTDL
jgi:serine/threonine-protein kinase